MSGANGDYLSSFVSFHCRGDQLGIQYVFLGTQWDAVEVGARVLSGGSCCVRANAGDASSPETASLEIEWPMRRIMLSWMRK